MRKMTPQQLKNSILQMAMQGKLVEQRPEEGTGEALYQEIQAEKKKLIQEGKIKKSKKLPEITEEEIPFEIPQSWKWVRLSSTISLLSGSDLKPDQYNSLENGIPYITGASNFNINNLIINRWTTCPKNIAHKGDLLLTCKGTVGKTTILQQESVHIARQIMAITPICIDTVFLKYYIESQVENLKSKAKSMIPGIERKNVLTLLFPLPPLAEQKRIVAKLEEIQPLLDRYEKAYNRLEAYNQKFPENLKKSILQYAIEGKLVEQRSEEGTGEALYQEIQAEKKKLIQAGKIKKSKKLPEIMEEEIPFEIPENWKWVRLDDLGDYRKGPFGSSLTKSMFVPKSENSIKVYEQKNAIKKNWHLGDYYITKDYYNEKMKNFTVSPGDIIVSCAGTIGETYVMPEDIELGIINQALMRMKIFKPINVDFFLIYFEYILKRQARKNSKGSAIKNIPPFSIFKKLLFPLPPLKEQDRIVSKIEELMAMVEALEEEK
jgi:type I restriction enzyme S subunit